MLMRFRGLSCLLLHPSSSTRFTSPLLAAVKLYRDQHLSGCRRRLSVHAARRSGSQYKSSKRGNKTADKRETSSKQIQPNNTRHTALGTHLPQDSNNNGRDKADSPKSARHSPLSAPIQPGDVVQLTCDKLALGGRGVCRLPPSGFVILCRDCLPGERVTAVVTDLYRSYAEADKLASLSPPFHPATPRCKHFQQCGGCTLQNLDYEAQLAAKQDQVAQLLQRVAKVPSLEGIMKPVVAAKQTYNYRNKMVFHFAAPSAIPQNAESTDQNPIPLEISSDHQPSGTTDQAHPSIPQSSSPRSPVPSASASSVFCYSSQQEKENEKENEKEKEKEPTASNSNLLTSLVPPVAPLVLGLLRPGSFTDVLPIDDCEVQHPIGNKLMHFVALKAAELGLTAYDPNTQQGLLKQLVIRKGTVTATAVHMSQEVKAHKASVDQGNSTELEATYVVGMSQEVTASVGQGNSTESEATRRDETRLPACQTDTDTTQLTMGVVGENSDTSQTDTEGPQLNMHAVGVNPRTARREIDVPRTTIDASNACIHTPHSDADRPQTTISASDPCIHTKHSDADRPQTSMSASDPTLLTLHPATNTPQTIINASDIVSGTSHPVIDTPQTGINALDTIPHTSHQVTNTPQTSTDALDTTPHTSHRITSTAPQTSIDARLDTIPHTSHQVTNTPQTSIAALDTTQRTSLQVTNAPQPTMNTLHTIPHTSPPAATDTPQPAIDASDTIPHTYPPASHPACDASEPVFMLNLVVSEAGRDQIHRLRPLADAIMAAVPEVRSVYGSVGLKTGSGGGLEGVQVLRGQATITEHLCGLEFSISPASFFQVNTRQAEVLYNLAANAADLKPHECLLDLYCGTGTIGLSMARRCRVMHGFDICAPAIEDAKRNARLNGIKNASFHVGDVDRVGRELAKIKPDVVVVDPARAGLGTEVVKFLRQCNARRIISISCNPATLARDLQRLCATDQTAPISSDRPRRSLTTATKQHSSSSVVMHRDGYKLISVQPCDMFPHTDHIECVAVLDRV